MSIGLLDKILFPKDLKKLDLNQLPQLSEELRQFIIDVVSSNPGHFGASLGVVELTVALHYIFDTPKDKIIWDVGHQAYGHKILTGRKNEFHTNRKYKGLSGFPNPSESEYDSFGVGHSSTSISAALGMARAAKFKNEEDKQVVAVIGDGSMTGGLAFEGLNNAGIENTNLLVILNDNNMAIDPNVGALKEYLLDITTSKTYNKFKTDVWNMLGYLNKLGRNYQKLAQQIENAIKSFLLKQSNLFESLNFRYFGPIDGHDVVYLAKILKDLKDIKGPKLLHVITQKGKGFKQAEINQTTWHAPGKFDKHTGEILKIKSDKLIPPKYQDVFGHTIVELAKQNNKVVGITPAMPTGCSLNIMMKEMPERTFDVGIAEQHAVTFSAGLAIEGMLPFCNIYSSFMQRAYDQVIHDVALQNLNVVFCLDRGGLVGEDGATHHGVYDLAYFRSIPNIIVSAPINEEELRNLMYTAQLPNKGVFSIRYPRGRGVMPQWETPFKEIEIGKGEKIREGKDIAVLSIGHIGNFVIEATKELAKKRIDVAHYNMRFVKPIDENILHEVGKNFKTIVTIEDGTIVGGLGSAVLEFMNDHGYMVKVKRLGVPDKFIEHGTPQELYKECGFDTNGIIECIKNLVKPNLLSNVG
ncbi:MAG: 1-deoxy-D-xylulose-5-phosphate synthase [Bacteroidales bacterium]|nr:1-deoxy-D-xylulose-5-phosphate synthase [Bacteroidales bacterium]